MTSPASSSLGEEFKMIRAEIPVIVSGSSESQWPPQHPQRTVDEFWRSFNTKTPGKATTLLPKNELAERLAKRSAAKDRAGGSSKTTTTSYEEAAALCRAKVEKIVAECRRVNQKYRDPHFDLDYDLKSGSRDCLESLSNRRDDYPSDDDSSVSSETWQHPRKLRRSGPRLGPRSHGGSLLEKEPAVGQKPRGQNENGARELGVDGVAAGPGKTGSRWPGSDFNPQSVKRVGEIFDDPKFYIDGPTANDVRQGRDGDCWLMAALCTMSNKPGLIERVCVAHNQDVGVYGFVFHRDGEWFSEIIDDKLYLLKPDYDQAWMGRSFNIERMLWEDIDRPDSEEVYRRTYQSNSSALYFAQCENPNETWLPLLEKAYAKAHGDYAAIEGGFTGEGIEDLTGGVTTELFTTDILDKEYFWKEELMKVNKDFLFGCSTGLWGLGYGERKGIQEGHAYSIMRAVEIDGQRLLLLKNPWGKGEWRGPWSDGSKEWTPEWLQKLDHRFGDDGAFWMSYKDLLRKFQTFDRTRLFGPEWKVTSMWTTLNVPWSLEYHHTKFSFTLAKPGPVVIVLSQLDDRYFRGLEGPYSFGLGFRVHRAGEEDYLVRTQSSYRMTRSCNVELDLEAGEYTVLIKIDATRNDNILPPEDVVRLNAKDRREKLLRIGLAYDLAHSKARTVETAEEKAAREAYEKREREKRREQVRKSVMETKKRVHYFKAKELRSQRRDAARRKKKEKEKAEKRKAKRRAASEERRRREEEEEEKAGGDLPVQGAEHEPAGQDLAPGEKDNNEPEISGEKQEHGPEGGKAEVEGNDSRESSAPTKCKDEGKGAEGEQAGAVSSGGQEGSSPAESKDGEDTAKSDTPAPDASTDAEENTPSTSSSDEPASKAADAEGKKAPVTESSGDGKETASTETAAPPADENAQDPTTPKQTDSPAEVAQGSDSAEVPQEETPNVADSKESPLRNAELEEKLRKALDVVSHIKEDLEGLLDEKQEDSSDDEQEYTRRPRTVVRSLFGSRRNRYRHRAPSAPSWDSSRRAKSEDEDGSNDNSDEDESTDDDLGSLPSVSDISDTELDYLVQDHDKQAGQHNHHHHHHHQHHHDHHHQPPSSSYRPRSPSLSEFEQDPWNAVAVVGLRIYYKVAEEDRDEEGLVKLRVVRPNRYELSDEDETEGEGKDEKKGEEKEGEEDDDEKKKDVAKVLDLDDSAKDVMVKSEGDDFGKKWLKKYGRTF